MAEGPLDESLGPIVWHYLCYPTFSRLDTIPECDIHTHMRIVDEWERLDQRSTPQWRIGDNDRERVLMLKEDSLNMNCDSWCNSVVATVQSTFAV